MHVLLYNIDPFPSPSDVRLVEVNPNFLTFEWSSVVTNCSAIDYIIESDCGYCPSTANVTSVNCSLWPKAASGQCGFAVKTVVCGGTVGNSSNTVYVTLKGKKLMQVHVLRIQE